MGNIETRALTNDELDMVSGGKEYTSHSAGVTFHLAENGDLTISAGPYEVTTGKGFVMWSGPT